MKSIKNLRSEIYSMIKEVINEINYINELSKINNKSINLVVEDEKNISLKYILNGIDYYDNLLENLKKQHEYTKLSLKNMCKQNEKKCTRIKEISKW